MTVYIHALREEGDVIFSRDKYLSDLFLSTLSARRATVSSVLWYSCTGNFYPRPPRGGRRKSCHSRLRYLHFYPRPPRGGRPLEDFSAALCAKFLSTPSARRATAKTEKKSLLLFHYKSFCTKWKELQLCRTRKVRILWQKHPFFRCEENGKSMSACASHTEKSEDQRAVLLETGVKADVLDL